MCQTKLFFKCNDKGFTQLLYYPILFSDCSSRKQNIVTLFIFKLKAFDIKFCSLGILQMTQLSAVYISFSTLNVIT